MVALREFSWEEAMSPDFGTPARAAWREAVAEIAAKAKATLPQCNGRVDKAVAIVLNGDVELLPDGKAKVASQSNGATQYFVVNGTCECKDFPKAPSGWCKHRLAAGMQKRAQALVQRKLNGASNGHVDAPPAPAQAEAPTAPQADAPTMPHAEAPAETPEGVPAQHVVLIALTAEWTYNDGELSLAHAVATFQDGRRFEESGDATPANTNRKVAVHFRRVALTRAKARVLRDALGIDLVAVEELADE